MAENTRIEWATHTWNPWLGCSPKHVGCTNCYAQAYFHRMGIGPDVRRRTSDANWQKPLAWNKQAAEAERQYEALCKYWLAAHGNQNISGKPERTRVFPSLCDPFEDWVSRKGHPKIVTDPQGHDLYVATPDGYVPKPIGFDSRWEACTLNHLRIDMFNLIDQTPNLDWLLLTKRPENVRKMWEGTPILGKLPDRTNVWLIYSASDQATLEAGLRHLLACRDLVPVLGLSLEPLVGPVDLSGVCEPLDSECVEHHYCGPSGGSPLNWVVIGGESGPGARPCRVEWITDLVDQCREAGVPCFVKQDSATKPGTQGRIPDECWRIKEFPVVSLRGKLI